MPFQSSLGRFRLALLAALGASSLTACSGSVLDGTDNTLGSQDAGSGGGSASGGQGGVGNDAGAGGGSASGGQGGVGNDAGAGGAPNGGAPACINPKPVVPEGEFGGPSRGYIQCENGVVHRVAAQACWSKLGPPDAGVVVPPGPDGSVTFNCRTNADCTDAPHGYCVIDSSGDPWDGLVSTVCRYGCVQDSDCDAGSICRCGDPVGTCVQASCKTDADCDGAFCQEGYDSSSCSPSRVTYRCGPRCTSDADCAEPSGFGYTCTNGNCQENAVCGRPFLVEG
ncbi:MAG: hypothetical protein FJ104_12510, partial [Deltaproteobacteria bacterium]|nr:hypothetical protein [Deltaproteobacteria bacterium]